MKKIKICVCLIVFVLIMAGCGKEELENKSFVLALGMDVENDNMKIIYNFPDLSRFTEQNKGRSSGNFIAECSDLQEGLEFYQNTSDKKIDFAHLKCIVMSEDFFKSKFYHKTLTGSLEAGVFADNIPVLITEDNLTDILKNDNVESGSVGDFLANMITNYDETRKIKSATLNTLLKNTYNNNTEHNILKLSYENDLYELSEYKIS